MAREVFIDAGAWIAVTSRSDQYHALATEVYRRLLREKWTLVTTNLVTAEAYNGIRRFATQAQGGAFLASLRESGRIIRIYSDEGLEFEAEQLLRKYADHDLSLADAVSFVVMRKRNIVDAFAFDNHFMAVGFNLLR